MIQPDGNRMDDYLISDEVVNWRESKVLTKALELTSDLMSDLEKARRLFYWVRDEIPHSDDIGSERVPCSASEVLKEGTGICYAKSHLLAALLRANHIPAGFCYQVLSRDPPFKGFALHGLNGIYLSSLKKWIRVDSRGNTGDIDAQFGIERERLAYTVDPAAGEFMVETVFVSPAPVVIEVLRKYTTRSALWPNLPHSLELEDLDNNR